MNGLVGALFRSDSVVASLGFYLPTTALHRLLGLARTVALTWLILQSEFGLLQVALLIINILMPLCGLGLHEAAIRFAPQFEGTPNLRAFARRVLIAGTVVAIIGCGAVYFLADTLGGPLFATFVPQADPGTPSGPAQQPLLVRQAAVCVLTLIMFHLLGGLLKGLRMFRALCVYELTGTVLFTAGAIGVAVAGHGSCRTILWCYAGANLVSLGLFGVGLLAALSSEDDSPPSTGRWSGVVQLMRYGLWVGLAAVMWHAMQYVPVWYLFKQQGAEAAGTFGAVRGITQVVHIIAAAVAAVVLAAVSKTWESQGPGAATYRLHLAAKACLCVLLALCALIVTLGDVVMHLFPQSFALGKSCLGILLLFYLLNAALSFVTIHFNLLKKTSLLFVPWVIGVGCNIWLAVVLVHSADGQAGEVPMLSEALRGAAWASAAGIGLAWLVCAAILWQQKITPDRGLVLLTAAAALLCFKPVVAVVGVGVLVVAAVFSPLVFTKSEKSDLYAFIRKGLHVKAWLTDS